MPDEQDPASIRSRIESADTIAVSSEIVRIEVASAVRAAERAGRVTSAARLLARMEAIFQEDGRVTLIRLRPEAIFPRAYRIVLDHHMRTLDAIHLAVAMHDATAIAGGSDLVFMTRDAAQAEAATALGFTVE